MPVMAQAGAQARACRSVSKRRGMTTPACGATIVARAAQSPAAAGTRQGTGMARPGKACWPAVHGASRWTMAVLLAGPLAGPAARLVPVAATGPPG